MSNSVTPEKMIEPETPQEILNLEKQSLLPKAGAVVSTDSPSLAKPSGDTVIYLAFGSNLAQSTFEGRRRVRPLAQVNAHAPDYELTFDLPGVAYIEPCFANSRSRRSRSSSENSLRYRDNANPDQVQAGWPDTVVQENMGWSKGLVGTAYQVSAADYRHIIETEGGGAGYQDVVVKCWPLPKDLAEVPEPGSYPEPSEPPRAEMPELSKPNSQAKPFLAHTLLAPLPPRTSNLYRKPNWAQPSERYLNLIRTGARERGLPREYVAWLDNLQPYHATTLAQRIGKVSFTVLCLPIFIVLIALPGLISDERGRTPKWYNRIQSGMFEVLWWSYDRFFKSLAGDGERTVGS